MHPESIATYTYPDGSFWAEDLATAKAVKA
jgi:hypothetical protein